MGYSGPLGMMIANVKSFNKSPLANRDKVNGEAREYALGQTCRGEGFIIHGPVRSGRASSFSLPAGVKEGVLGGMVCPSIEDEDCGAWMINDVDPRVKPEDDKWGDGFAYFWQQK